MGKIYDGLKKYFEETPQNVLECEAKALDYLNAYGPDAMEYIECIRAYCESSVYPIEVNVPVSCEEIMISSDQPYYKAA